MDAPATGRPLADRPPPIAPHRPPTPAHAGSIDPGGRWLLVANRDSHNIVSLPLNGQGLLGDAAAEVSCPSPVCLTRYAWTGRDPG